MAKINLQDSSDDDSRETPNTWGSISTTPPPSTNNKGAAKTMTDVNFDEFQAIRRRKAQDDEEDEDQKEEPATTPKAEEDEEPDGLAERAGAFAELPEVQLLLCVAILADVAGAAVTAARDDGAPAFLVRAAAAFPGFVNFLYAFELLALATAFKLRMLTHPGLLLDVGIVSARRRRPLLFRRVDGVFGAALWPWPFTLSTSGRRQLGSTGFIRQRHYTATARENER